MDDQLKNEIFEVWNINGLPRDQQIIKLFEKVRDIPFGRMGSREPKDVYEKNKGTCSGKNFLLKELYEAIGVKTKDIVCLQRWKDLTWFPDDTYDVVKLPNDLFEILETNEIVDFHNYLKIFVDEKWVTVDVTIDLPLKKLGFYTTEKWDGKSDMPLCFVGTHKVWDCGDKGLEKKLELTKALPVEVEEERIRFLKGLTKWLDGLRAEGKI
jgi:hypothetical protein